MKCIEFNLKDAEVFYYPEFIEMEDAEIYFNRLLNSLEWEQYSVKIFGKKIPQPRLSALYSVNNTAYTYSGLCLQPHSFTKELWELNHKIYKICKTNFSHCLANLYRNGKDSMGWHSDNEKILGKNPVIASLSFWRRKKIYAEA